MKRKIFTLLLVAFWGSMSFAQDYTGVLKKAPEAPVIDGVMDPIWLGANTYNIAQPFSGETPTVGAEGTTYWKGLWTDEGLYFYVKVNDDEWYPAYMNSSSDNWLYDKVEIYFDVNAVLKDGLGGKNSGDGHIQVAPGVAEADIRGTMTTDGDGTHAYLVTEPSWAVEYFIPFTRLKDKDGNVVATTATIGFDVTAIDGESIAPGVRQRAVWSNPATGPAAAESWANMDDCGTITLSDEIAEGGGLVKKTDVAPVIDGEVDAVWENANVYNVDKPFKTEVPTLGDPGQTTWKALWDANGVYVLVQVTDDAWLPYWAPGGGSNGYEYDKVEIYFNSNAVLKDGTGGQTGGNGKVQIAPDSKEGSVDGQKLTGTDRMSIDYFYAIKVSDPNWVAEYFVPWEMLTDKDGVAFDKTGKMGFDVDVTDRDPGDTARKRAMWSNIGNIDENWNNMDDAGVIMFDGATEVIMVEKVKVSGGTEITTDGGTLQLTATVEPVDASVQKVKWVVENGTGEASVNKDGLVTAIKNGTVLVKAVATDGSFEEGKVTVTISGQVIDANDMWNVLNQVKNWSFEEPKNGQFPPSWGGWVDLATAGCENQLDPAIEDGAVVMKVGLASDNANWHYQLNQSGFTCEANVPYILKFKTWASADATPCAVDFEDTSGNNYTRYGASSDAEAQSGRSEWHYNADIMPMWYTFHVTFDQMVDNTVQKVQWMNSLSNESIYLDSVLLIKEADYGTGVKTLANAKSKVQLYPNPVQTELTVSKIAVANSKVSVYNAVGQKLMEKTANGTQAKFDVANLRKGMYFVRFTDGTSEKFIKQ